LKDTFGGRDLKPVFDIMTVRLGGAREPSRGKCWTVNVVVARHEVIILRIRADMTRCAGAATDGQFS
jgi:hypothetical protein